MHWTRYLLLTLLGLFLSSASRRGGWVKGGNFCLGSWMEFSTIIRRNWSRLFFLLYALPLIKNRLCIHHIQRVNVQKNIHRELQSLKIDDDSIVSAIGMETYSHNFLSFGWFLRINLTAMQVVYTTANFCSSLAADLSIFQGFKISFYLTFLCVAQFARECFHADFQISRFPDYQAKIHVSKLTTYLHICMFPHF